MRHCAPREARSDVTYQSGNEDEAPLLRRPWSPRALHPLTTTSSGARTPPVVVSTPDYMAPEVCILDEPRFKLADRSARPTYGRAADVWSAGVM